MWDWLTGYNFQRLQAAAQPGSIDSETGIFALAFDQSGSRLLTCEADKTIKIYKEDETAVSFTLSYSYLYLYVSICLALLVFRPRRVIQSTGSPIYSRKNASNYLNLLIELIWDFIVELSFSSFLYHIINKIL